MQTDTQLAWLAGFIDGEGCVRISRDRTRHDNLSYTLSIQISQKDPAILREIQANWGGSLYHKQPERNGGVYNLQIKSRQGAVLLEALLPYLRVKRTQAELALGFQARRLTKSLGRVRADRTQDEADFQAIKAMKVFEGVV